MVDYFLRGMNENPQSEGMCFYDMKNGISLLYSFITVPKMILNFSFSGDFSSYKIY